MEYPTLKSSNLMFKDTIPRGDLPAKMATCIDPAAKMAIWDNNDEKNKNKNHQLYDNKNNYNIYNDYHKSTTTPTTTNNQKKSNKQTTQTNKETNKHTNKQQTNRPTTATSTSWIRSSKSFLKILQKALPREKLFTENGYVG